MFAFTYFRMNTLPPNKTIVSSIAEGIVTAVPSDLESHLVLKNTAYYQTDTLYCFLQESRGVSAKCCFEHQIRCYGFLSGQNQTGVHH